jgi:hypothetical protein
MRHIDGLYTQRFNRAHGRDGPLFRGRYRAILVEADAYLSAVVRYIHRNPVAAGLVAQPEAYPWSSHRSYLTPRQAPPWLQTGEVLAEFAGPRAFHRFVVGGHTPDVDAFYSLARQAPVLGGERFRTWVGRKVPIVARDHPRHERQLVGPSEATVLVTVAESYGVAPATLRTGRRGIPNEPRKIAMYLVHRLCDLTLKETAARFGVGSAGVIGWACGQVRHRLARDTRFREQLGQVEGRISQQKT